MPLATLTKRILHQYEKWPFVVIQGVFVEHVKFFYVQVEQFTLHDFLRLVLRYIIDA